jgi:hypothetical protein
MDTRVVIADDKVNRNPKLLSTLESMVTAFDLQSISVAFGAMQRVSRNVSMLPHAF